MRQLIGSAKPKAFSPAPTKIASQNATLMPKWRPNPRRLSAPLLQQLQAHSRTIQNFEIRFVPNRHFSTGCYEYEVAPINGKTYIQTKVTDPDGSFSLHLFDEYGRVVRETQSDRSRVLKTWNSALTTGTAPVLARPIELKSETDPFGFVTEYEYDVNGNRIATRRHHVKVGTQFAKLVTRQEYLPVLVGTGDTAIRFFQLMSEKLQKEVENNPAIEITSVTYEYENAAGPPGWNTGFIGNPTRMTESGRVTKYTYDIGGHLATTTTPSGLITTYLTDLHATNRTIEKRNIKVEGPGLVTSSKIYQYDVYGNLDSVEVPTNLPGAALSYARTEFDHDVLNRLTEQRLINPVGEGWNAVSLYMYDAAGNVIRARDARGQWTTSIWTKRNQLAAIRGPGGGLASYVYDAAGNMTSTIDAVGDKTGYVYDSRNRIIETLRADGTRTFTNYDGASRPVAQIDANGGISYVEYDSASRVIKTQNAMGAADEKRYDERGNLVWSKDVRGNVTTLGYDEFGRVVSTKQFEGDPVSNPSAPLLAASKTTYTNGPQLDTIATTNYRLLQPATALSDLENVVNAEKLDTKTEYDKRGLAVRAIDQELNETTTSYDLAGRVFEVTDANGNVTKNIYYVGSGWLKATERRGEDVPDSSQPSPQPLIDGPAQSRIAYKYNALGAVIESAVQVDRANASIVQTTKTRYDELGRPIFVLDAANSKLTEANQKRLETLYGTKGQIVSQVDQLGRSSLAVYDSLGRKITETLPDPDREGPMVAPQTSFTYDGNGNLLTTTDPLGRITTNLYDAANRLTSTTLPDPDGDPAKGLKAPKTNYYYDLAGNRTLVEQAMVGSSLVRQTGYVYHALNRVIATVVPDATVVGTNTNYGKVLFGENTVFVGWTSSTAYDSLGNISSTTDAEGRQTLFAYDKVGRLKTKTLVNPYSGFDGVANGTDDDANLVYQYAYDAVGNLKTVTDPANKTTTYFYDALNRKTSEELPAVTTYKSGITATNVRPTTSYAYDMVGNLTQVTSPSGSVTKYQYDELNRKTKEFLPDPVTGLVAANASPNMTCTYDAVGNIITAVDVLNRVTNTKYDALNRRIQVTLPDPQTGNTDIEARGPSTRFIYDAVGNLETTIDALGRESSTIYDQLNRAVYRIAPNLADGKTHAADGSLETGGAFYGVATYTEYDGFGNIARTFDRIGNETVFGYDVLNRKGT